jgi:hypothetical protein
LPIVLGCAAPTHGHHPAIEREDCFRKYSSSILGASDKLSIVVECARLVCLPDRQTLSSPATPPLKNCVDCLGIFAQSRKVLAQLTIIKDPPDWLCRGASDNGKGRNIFCNN